MQQQMVSDFHEQAAEAAVLGQMVIKAATVQDERAFHTALDFTSVLQGLSHRFVRLKSYEQLS